MKGEVEEQREEGWVEEEEVRHTQDKAGTRAEVTLSPMHSLQPAPTASLHTCCTCTIGLVQVVVRLLWLT